AVEMVWDWGVGRASGGVREDDIVATTLGKNVVMLRVKAFALGGAIIGVAGAFHAYYLTYIDPSQFSATITAYVFMAVIAGGRGSNPGLLLGAAAIMVFIQGTRFLKDLFNFLGATHAAALPLILIGLRPVPVFVFPARISAQDHVARPRAAVRIPERTLREDRMARVGFVPASDLPANVARIYEQYATGYGPFRNQVAVFAHVPSAVEHITGLLLDLK